MKSVINNDMNLQIRLTLFVAETEVLFNVSSLEVAFQREKKSVLVMGLIPARVATKGGWIAMRGVFHVLLVTPYCCFASLHHRATTDEREPYLN